MSYSDQWSQSPMGQAFAMALAAEDQAKKMAEFIHGRPWDEIDEVKRREMLWQAMANLGFAVVSAAKDTESEACPATTASPTPNS